MYHHIEHTCQRYLLVAHLDGHDEHQRLYLRREHPAAHVFFDAVAHRGARAGGLCVMHPTVDSDEHCDGEPSEGVGGADALPACTLDLCAMKVDDLGHLRALSSRRRVTSQHSEPEEEKESKDDPCREVASHREADRKDAYGKTCRRTFPGSVYAHTTWTKRVRRYRVHIVAKLASPRNDRWSHGG